MFKAQHPITTFVVAGIAAVAAVLPSVAVAKHRHIVRHYQPEIETYTRAPCYPMPACAGPNAVMSAGTYVGSDPDPRMRAMLLSDFNRGVYSTRGR
jgi:hypothetical protein